ncbi:MULTISPECIES: tetratricopeptide repeat protein [unclassified Frankia]|uniref:tetratricopeptide repeat protein n=1 Tax=unclassified Frankia TaxID=2632575 RepID=UPI002AD55854|nr:MULTISPECIES: tetratricopeptide repeat protein [unclassified Frankia]
MNGLGRVRAILEGVGISQTPGELAEALWLADQLRSASTAAPGGQSPDDSGRTGSDDPGTSDLAMPAREVPAAQPRPSADGTADGEPVGGLHLPDAGRSGFGRQPDPRPIMLPAKPALSRSLRLVRALRPLKRLTEPRATRALDEELTVEHSARARAYLPVISTAQRPRLDVVVLSDMAPSMVVWDSAVREFGTLLHGLSAFEHVRRERFDSAEMDGDVGWLRMPGSAGMRRQSGEFVVSRGRQVVMVFSDCVGVGWRTGRVQRTLAAWGRSVHVVIVQPFPEHLWRLTGLDIRHGRLSSPRPGANNAALRFTEAGRPRTASDRTASGVSLRGVEQVPVPVVQLHAAWLANWARLVGGDGRGIDAAVCFGSRPSSDADTPADGLSVREKFLAFRREATPEAVALATYLAVLQTFTVDLMSVVQHRMLSAVDPSHRAEVLTSGLVTSRRRADAGTAGPAGRPSDYDLGYTFTDEARSQFLSSIGRANLQRMLRVVDEVSESLGRALGATPHEFTAAIALDSMTGSVALGAPFGYLTLEALRRGGSPYASLVAAPDADMLSGAEPGTTERPDPEQARDLAALAELHFRHFQRAGRSRDLTEALGAYKDAVEMTLVDDPDRIDRVVGLAAVLCAYDDTVGDPASINAAVSALRDGVRDTVTGRPEWFAGTVALATTLLRRNSGHPGIDDLAEASALWQQLLRHPGAEQVATYATGLADTLTAMYVMNARISDIDDAVDARRQAVQATDTGDPELPRRLIAYARALRIRGRIEDHVVPLRRAVAAASRLAGGEDAAVLAARHELAVGLFHAGFTDEAHAELRDVIQARRQVLGQDHPDTVASLAVLEEFS